MPIISLKTGTKSRSLLVGNPYFVPSSYESIASATGTGSNTTITFSSIPSTYASLQLRIFSIDTYTAGNGSGGLTMRFNSDSGTNYTNHRLRCDDATNIAAQGSIGNTANLYSAQNAYSTGGLTGAASIIDIHDYASTSKYKTVRAFSGSNNNATAGDFYLFLTSNLWLNTNAINQIEISGPATAFKAGSTFALYGIKG
jgi:hypothetical protein